MRGSCAHLIAISLLLSACFNPVGDDDTSASTGSPASTSTAASTASAETGPEPTTSPGATSIDPASTSTTATTTTLEPDTTTTAAPDTTDTTDIPPPGCGDGILAPEEDCEDGNLDDADGCDSTCVREVFYIFATDAKTDGDFGGVKNADDACKTAATQIGRHQPLNYVALMSSSGSPAQVRVQGSGGRPYVRPKDLAYVAMDTPSLLAGAFIVPVLYTESGTEITGGADCNNTEALVWTGTNLGGTAAETCNDWMAGGTIARVGVATTAGDLGLHACTPSCAGLARVYCVENP